MPCDVAVSGFIPPTGKSIDWGKVNVNFTDQTSKTTTIGQVSNAAACPSNQPAWYHDNAAAPTSIQRCPTACTLVTRSAVGSHVNVVVGCEDTVIVDPLL